MKNPKLFPDEIADRLRDLKHDDVVIVRSGFQENNYYLRQTMRNDDGIAWTYRRFETKNGYVIPDIVNRLYEEAEAGKELFVKINNVICKF